MVNWLLFLEIGEDRHNFGLSTFSLFLLCEKCLVHLGRVVMVLEIDSFRLDRLAERFACDHHDVCWELLNPSKRPEHKPIDRPCKPRLLLQHPIPAVIQTLVPPVPMLLRDRLLVVVSRKVDVSGVEELFFKVNACSFFDLFDLGVLLFDPHGDKNELVRPENVFGLF